MLIRDAIRLDNERMASGNVDEDLPAAAVVCASVLSLYTEKNDKLR